MKSSLTKGSITIELLIAFAVLIFSTSAVVIVVFGNQSVTTDTQTNNEALYRAQTMLEQARALSRQDFSLVGSLSTTTEQSGSVVYTKKLSVADIDSFTKQATSTITWQIGTRFFNVVLSTLLTNPKSALSGNQCSPTLTGDWTAPQIYGYIDFPSAAGGSSVRVQGGKAYITSDPNSPGTDDFYVADVSGAGPGVTGLPILGHFSTSYGLTSVQTFGQYAFVAADSAQYQLLVIDKSDPAALSVSKIRAKRDVTAPGDAAYGNILLYANKKIYLGLTKSDGPELHIFDVSSSTNPVELGSGYEVDAAINQIALHNNTLYLSTASTSEVIALDVTTPSAPTPVGVFTSATLTGQGLAFASSTGKLYFGRTGGNGNPKLMGFTSSNISSPEWTLDMSNQGGVYTIVQRSGILFLTTADPNDGLQLWDASSAGPGTPPTRYDTSSLNIQQTATAGSDCFGNLLYVAQRSNRAMQVVGPFVPFSYALSPSNPNLSVTQGSSGTDTITAALISGISQNVNFSAVIPPAATGVTASFAPNKCNPDCSTVLTINTSASTPAGTYTITINGTGGVSTTFNLIVTVPTFNYTLSTPTDVTLIRSGSSQNTSFTATKTLGTTQPVNFTNSALPTGVTMNYSATSCSPTCTTTLTLSASASAATGTTTVTITGDSPSHSTSFTLVVNPAAFDYSLTPPVDTSVKKGSFVYATTTVTMNPGAIAQSVTVTPSGMPSGLTVTPTSASCTPSTGSCDIGFRFNASAAISGQPNVTITLTGVSPTHTTTFKIKVNN